MMIDIFMPHMRGFESIRILHEHALRSIVLSPQLG
ncbi:YesN/AraC family two-component response regulator [Bradyrhizobium japonicum]